MRDIKFRVATKFCGDNFIGDVRTLELDDGDYYGECNIWLHSYGGESQDFDTTTGDILQQYTGLKDCNGVEIYDGDIVEVGYHCTEMSPTRHVVEYQAKDDYPAYELVSPISNEINSISDILSGCYGHMSVVGNIHENPELLEV